MDRYRDFINRVMPGLGTGGTVPTNAQFRTGMPGGALPTTSVYTERNMIQNEQAAKMAAAKQAWDAMQAQRAMRTTAGTVAPPIDYGGGGGPVTANDILGQRGPVVLSPEYELAAQIAAQILGQPPANAIAGINSRGRETLNEDPVKAQLLAQQEMDRLKQEQYRATAAANPSPVVQAVSDYAQSVRDAQGIDNTIAAATVAPLIKGVTSDTFQSGLDVVVPENVQDAAKTINNAYNAAYNWGQDQTGQDIYKQAMSGGKGTTLNPYFYLDAGIEAWTRDPQNKAKIQTVYEQGLDLDGDGTVDVRGGEAVMMVYNSEAHPGFFDAMMTSMGYDPLFAVSLVAPAAGAGREGAQAAAEAARLSGLTRAERVAMAVDRALAGVTVAGDVANKVADAPFSIPLWGGRKAAEAVSALPKGAGLVEKLKWPFSPSAETVKKLDDATARDVTETVTNPGGAVAATYSSANPNPNITAMGGVPEPTPGEPTLAITRGTDFEVGPGGQVTPARGDLFAGAPTTNPADLTPVAGEINVRRSNKQVERGIRRWVSEIGNDGDVRVVTRADNQFEVQVKPNGRWKTLKTFEDEGLALDYGKTLVRSGSDAAEQALKEMPVQQALPDAEPPKMPEPPKAEAIPEIPTTAREGAYWSINTKNRPDGLLASVERQFPEQYNAMLPELRALADEYEPRVKAANTRDPLQIGNEVYDLGAKNAQLRPDQKIARAEFYANIRELLIRNGIPVEALPNSPGAIPTGNGLEKWVGEALYSPDPKVASAARNQLYSANYAQSAVPRSTLADEIMNADLPRTSTHPNGSITVDGIPYTNKALTAMSLDARADLARRAVADQSIKYARGQRLKQVWQRLTDTRLHIVPPEIAMLGENPYATTGRAIPDAAMALRDAVAEPLWKRVIGEPEAPLRPDPQTVAPSAMVAEQPFHAEFKAFQTDEVNRMKQWGDLGDEEVAYLKQVVGLKENGANRTAWDVLADTIDKHLRTEMPDFTDPKAVRRWRDRVAQDFAAEMQALTGKPVPAAIKRNLTRKIVEGVASRLGTLNSIARQGMLYNPFTGIRGWAQDAISTGIKVMWEGHTSAALQGLMPNQWVKVARGERDAAELFADRLGMDIPDDLRVAGKFEPGAVSDRMALHETLNRWTGAAEGSVKDRVNRILTSPHSWVVIRDGRTATENTFRRAVFTDTVQMSLGKYARDFRSNARKWGAKYGILPSSMDAYLYELGDEFSPADVGVKIRELGKDAGLAGSATNELADMMAEQWRKSVNTLRNLGHKESRRVLFSYDKTNLDDFLGKFVFFHYWMSRSLPSYTRLALHNPELAALWFRAWDEVANRAEAQGYPASLVGMLRFMGNGHTGWSRYYNPLQFFIPFDVLQQDPFADTSYEKLTQFAMVSPVMQGLFAAMGQTDRAPDFLGAYAVRGNMVALLNEMRANGWIGEQRLQGDWFEQATNRAFEKVNAIGASFIPFVDDVHFRDLNEYNAEVMDYMMRDLIGEQVGVPYDATLQAWQPGGVYFEMWAEAKRDFAAGADNPIAAKAYKQWADEQVKSRAIANLMPGGIRSRYSPRDDALKLAADGPDGRPLDQGEADFRNYARSGEQADFDLNSLDDQYYNLGTSRQRDLASGWADIVYGDPEIDPSYGITVGGEFIPMSEITGMSDEERRNLADAWVADNGGTWELDQLRKDRKAFLAKHPEYGNAQEWRNIARDFDGGPRAFRLNRAKGNPNFKAAMDARRQYLLDNGTDPAVIDDELDAWALTLPAYEAAQGIKTSTSAEDPMGIGDQPAFDAMAAIGKGGGSSGGGSTKKAAMTESEKVAADLKDYDKEMAAVADILARYGYDRDALLSNNPLMRQGIENILGDAAPSPSKRVRLYWAWRDAVQRQDPNADVSLAAYQRVLDQMEQEVAA